MFDSVTRDLSYSARSLRRSPTFSITVVLILGIAIGMSSAMLTVFRAVLVEPLPVQRQERIVELSGVAGGAATEVPISPQQLQRLRGESRSLQSVAGFAHWRVVTDGFILGDRSVALREAVVTDGFFDVLGARSAVGRLFKPGDGARWGGPDAGVRAVLSYGAWMREFAGDSAVIGQRLRLPKMNWTTTIIGVAPRGLDYPRGVEVWVAADYGSLDVVARLAPGATVEASRQEFQSFLTHDPDAAVSQQGGTLAAQVHPLAEVVSGDSRPALLALTAAVALLLVLACTNAGNLLLLHAANRSREIAIRRAVGASALDVAGQLLTESTVLALIAGALGIALARVSLDVLVQLAPTSLPRIDLIAQAGTPLVLGIAVTAATVLLFGVLPSLASVRVDLTSSLRSGTRSATEGRRLKSVRQSLVALQIALAMIVLTGAGLVVRSLQRLASVDMGYSTAHLTTVNFSLPWARYPADCRPRDISTRADTLVWARCISTTNYVAHERVMANLHALPDVEAVSPDVEPPFLGANVWEARYAAQEQSVAESKANPWFGSDAVGPEFFRAIGVPIVAGRAFTDADNEVAPRVAVITENVAKKLWPKESYTSVIGKRLREDEQQPTDSLITVIGVAKDFHYREHRQSTPTVFRPYRQVLAQGYLVVRTRRSALSTEEARRAVENAGGGAIFIRAQSMDDLIAPQLATPRFDALLLSIFALTAIVLATVGLYGIMASSVAQQRRELSIRMALGATSHRVRNMVMRQAFVVAGAGTIAGIVGALIGSRLLSSMLFAVSPSDPATLIGVALLLLGAAATAAYIPARRATSIDPARALQAE
jgi:putative ABC transport system permease protein